MSAASVTQVLDQTAGGSPSPPPAASAVLAEGKALLSAGLAEDAVACLRQALELHPPDGLRADLAFNLGCALLACGRPGEALIPLRASAHDDLVGSFAWLQLATAEARLGRRLRAAVCLRQVVRLRPGWLPPRLRYGEALFRLGRIGAAMDQAVESLHRDPGSAAAHRLHGVLLCHRRQFARAALAFTAWTRAAPSDAMAELCLARARLLAGDRAAAQAAARRAIGHDAGLLRGHLLLARIARADGKPAPAQAHLRNAVGARPDLPIPRADLAAMMLRRSQLDAASAMAREALVLDPNCTAALVVLARCNIARGQLVRAQALVTQLTQSLPTALDLVALRQELAARRGGGAIQTAAAPKALPAPTVTVPALSVPALSVPALSAPAATAPAAAGGQAKAAPRLPAPRPQAPLPQGVRVAESPMPPPIVAPAAIARQQAAPPLVVARYGASRAPGFVDHLFIIRALILRDLRLKYRGNPFGVLMELVRPVAVMLAHYYLFLFLRKPMPGKIPIELYVIAGFSVWFAFNYTAQGAINGGKWPAGATALPGVTRMHLRLARALWAWLINLVFCLTAALPLSLYGDVLPAPDLLLTFAIFGMAGAMGFGLGLFMDQLGQVWPVIKPLEKLLTWALFVTCGLYFSLATTSPLLAAVVWYNPLLHLVEYQRHAFDAGYPVTLVTLTYPGLCAAGLLCTGMLAVRAFRHRTHD